MLATAAVMVQSSSLNLALFILQLTRRCLTENTSRRQTAIVMAWLEVASYRPGRVCEIRGPFVGITRNRVAGESGAGHVQF